MRELKLKAMAKVNLGLDVLRKREDGYHELKMVMQSVCLYDRLTLRQRKEPGVRVRTNLYYLPAGPENLAHRAAELLLKEFGISSGLEISLEKHIPVAAGLGGGSSDAAAVLVGVNRMFGLGLSREALMERGVKLGADVPFCIMRGTALAEGIGEKLTRLPDAPSCQILLAKPKLHISTKSVFGALRADQLTWHPDLEGQIAAIREGDLKGMARKMGNVLETVTAAEHPQITLLKEEMERAGALKAMMSGSGPTVFGLFDCRKAAREAYEKIRKGSLAKQVYLTTFFAQNQGREERTKETYG